MTLLEDLQNAVEADPENYAAALATEVGAIILEDDIVDTGRWENYHEVIFERDLNDGGSGEYVKGTYSEGATEMQDDTEKMWNLKAVKPVLVTVTKYETVYE